MSWTGEVPLFSAETKSCSSFFDVLLTVHLSIFISVINQLDAQNFCLTLSLFHASTCFEHMWSKHVEAWNKLIVKQKFCASIWLITEIKVLFCCCQGLNANTVFLPKSSCCFQYQLYVTLCGVACVIPGLRCGVNKVFAILDCYAALIGRYLPTFWDNLSVPSSRVKQSVGLRGCPEISVTNYE